MHTYVEEKLQIGLKHSLGSKFLGAPLSVHVYVQEELQILLLTLNFKVLGGGGSHQDKGSTDEGREVLLFYFSTGESPA